MKKVLAMLLTIALMMSLAVTAFAVESTPADCVRFAVLGMEWKFDLVILRYLQAPLFYEFNVA